jgi:hypothetical protein
MTTFINPLDTTGSIQQWKDPFFFLTGSGELFYSCEYSLCYTYSDFL